MSWKKLCGLAEVAPGELRTFVLEGIEMLVVRGNEAYLVIPPSCPHMANPLVEGFFDGCMLTCNKHLWQWSVEDGQPHGDAEVALLRYETETRDGQIWVNLSRELAYGHEHHGSSCAAAGSPTAT
jgi:toluene monooxygenase system ferredoxin subunit